jgi:hypothetical protein
MPPSEQPYTDYDFDVLGEIVHHATDRAARAAGWPAGACARPRRLPRGPRRRCSAPPADARPPRRPAGAQQLQQQQGLPLELLLRSYEAVLLRHSVLPEQDFHYYRLLLKLFLDPNPDWWAKLYAERMAARWAAGAAALRCCRRGQPGW